MASPGLGAITFLFTDIEGSTRLWEAHPAEMDGALARHDQLLSDIVTAHHGHVFKTVGDAFCVAFPAADAALAAALAVQRAVSAEPWPAATPIRVRMALHTGPAIRRDDDYFGPALNRTARILGLAWGGQTLVSDVTGQAGAALPDGGTLTELGTFRLRDLAQPARLFQLTHPELAADFPKLRSLDSLPTNLPVRHGEFIGREDAVAQVQARVQAVPLVTLTGPGGIGKTRLALQVGAEVLDAFPDGVWFVDLAPVTDPDVVTGAVAQALGLKEEVGKPLAETLVAWLRSRRLLLIVDNAEHVLEACADLVSQILAACVQVRVLTTSREPLNVASEVLWPVPPLGGGGRLPNAGAVSLVGDAGATSLAEVAADEAVQLFVARAMAAQPSFALTADNASAVATLCRRLDGIPLALELAAARVRVLSPAAILERLDDRFRLLTGGRRDAMPRHQTLRATLDWSYDLLTDPERRLLARLSVFRDDWTLDAAETVCGDEMVDVLDVLDGVARLVDRSLLTPMVAGGEDRYRLLETVRHYAAEKLDGFSETSLLRGRHLAWGLELAEAGAAALKGSEQAIWLDRLDRQHDDLRAAVDWALEAGEVGAGVRLGGALWRFWYLRGYLTEGRRRLGAVLEQTQGSGVQALEGAHSEALHGAATLAGYQGDFAAARTLHLESLGARRAAGDRAGEAASLNNLAIIAYQEGDYVAARDLYQVSLELKRSLGDRHGIANSLNNLALIAKVTGDLAAAAALYDEARAMYEALGDAEGVAQTLVNSANVAEERGEYDQARTYLAQGLELSRQLGDRTRVALIHYLQSLVAYSFDRLADAADLCRTSLEEERRLGNEPGVCRCVALQGQIALAREDPIAAKALLEEAREGQEALGDRHGLADTLCELGRVERALGDLSAARDCLGRGLVLLHASGRVTDALYAIEWLAGVAIEAGQPEPGLALLGAADHQRRRLAAVAEPRSARDAAADQSAARSVLGEAAATAAWARGQEMAYEQALGSALVLGT